MSNLVTLSISDISIRQDSDGRYCLNDLHKAAGNEPKQKPSEWLRNKQTVELITEVEKAGISAIQSKQQVGTFVVKELVYAYAMWISAKFHLLVIRAYDAMVMEKLQYGLKELPSQYITEEESYLFKKSIEHHCKNNGEQYRELYRKVYDHYGITSYKHIPAQHLTMAARVAGIKLVKVVKKDLPAEPERLSFTPGELEAHVAEKVKLALASQEQKTLVSPEIPDFRTRVLVTVQNGEVSQQFVPFNSMVIDPKNIYEVETMIRECMPVTQMVNVISIASNKMASHI